jgi:hypothetical protein
MAKRIMIFGILASLLQLGFYTVTTYVLWHLTAVFYEFRGDFESFILLSVPLFGFLLLFQNIIIEIINKKSSVILLLLFILIIYYIGWVEDVYGWPTQTILLLITGSITFILKFIFRLNYRSLKLLIVNLKSKCLYE